MRVSVRARQRRSSSKAPSRERVAERWAVSSQRIHTAFDVSASDKESGSNGTARAAVVTGWSGEDFVAAVSATSLQPFPHFCDIMNDAAKSIGSRNPGVSVHARIRLPDTTGDTAGYAKLVGYGLARETAGVASPRRGDVVSGRRGRANESGVDNGRGGGA